MTCRTEPASPLTLTLTPTAGWLSGSLCLLHLWRSELLCFALVMAGWVGTRSGLHSPSSVFWHFVLPFSLKLSPLLAASLAGRCLGSAWSPLELGSSLPPERAYFLTDISTCELKFIGPHGFPPLCVALPSGPAWREHGAGCLSLCQLLGPLREQPGLPSVPSLLPASPALIAGT